MGDMGANDLLWRTPQQEAKNLGAVSVNQWRNPAAAVPTSLIFALSNPTAALADHLLTFPHVPAPRRAMDTLIQDLRYALRRLRKSPGFSAIVILTLALGIGANTAIFSVVNAVLLRPLPYREPGRLVTVFHFYPSLNDLEAPVSAPGFRDYRDRVPSFESAAVETGWGPTLTGLGEPERLNGSRVSGDWFTTLGVAPLLGRPLRRDEDEPGKNKVVVLSHGLWQRLFGGDSSVVKSGHTMVLNGEPFEIVGVMPQTFRDFWNRAADLWTPLALAPAAFSDNLRTNEYLNFIARTKPGVTVTGLAKEMTAFATQLKKEFPNNYGSTWSLKPRSLNEQASGRIRTLLYVLLGAVGFVLLIACANVANLMLVRAAARQREVVIRTALGAQRAQLIRQLLTESVVLALCGGALGLALAYGGMRALVGINPGSLPRSDEIGIDPTVMVFTLVTAVVTGLLFGLVPALQTSRANLQETLKEGGRGSSAARKGQQVRRTLVVAQMALALTLLTGAGLLLKSFAKISGVDPGFRADHLLTFNLALPANKYRSDTAFRAYFDEVLPRIAAVQGVRAVGTTSVMPFSGSWSTGSFSVEGFQPAPNQPGPWGDIRVVNDGFFGMMGMRVLKGRTFGPQDLVSSPRVAVVDDELVHRFWPHDDPIGKRLTFNNLTDTSIRWIEVIGVVGHSKHEALDAKARIQMYLPYQQNAQRQVTVGVRTSLEPLAMTNAVRTAVQSVDKDQPLARIQSMDQMLSNSVGQRKLSTVLIGLFAALALVLASIGIYGVMSYTVTQRAQEIGIRMALGAARGDVLGLVVRQGMELAVLGVLLGVFAGLWLTKLIATQLFDVGPRDPWTFAPVAALLACVALLATLVPALRATKVDPVNALRAD
jgi:putative ABC transport system permease protein